MEILEEITKLKTEQRMLLTLGCLLDGPKLAFDVFTSTGESELAKIVEVLINQDEKTTNVLLGTILRSTIQDEF